MSTRNTTRNVYMATRVARPRYAVIIVAILTFGLVYVVLPAFVFTCARFAIRDVYRTLRQFARAIRGARSHRKSVSLADQVIASQRAADQAIRDMRARKSAQLNRQLRTHTFVG